MQLESKLFGELSDLIKNNEKRMVEIGSLLTHINNYSELVPYMKPTADPDIAEISFGNIGKKFRFTKQQSRHSTSCRTKKKSRPENH